MRKKIVTIAAFEISMNQGYRSVFVQIFHAGGNLNGPVDEDFRGDFATRQRFIQRPSGAEFEDPKEPVYRVS